MKKLFTLCLVSAFLLTGAALATTIQDIQETTDPGGAPPDTCYPSPLLDSTVTITATVTAVKQGSYDNYHLQDNDGAWDGIYVYSTVGDPQLGDNVTIEATVAEYRGMTELANVTSYTLNSQGNPFDTVEVNCNQIRQSCDFLSEPWEGQLVKIDDPTVDSAGSYGQHYISDYTGQTAIIDDEFYKYGGNQPTIVVGETYQHIMGVVHYSYGEYVIYPRFADDVLAYEDPPPEVDRAFTIPGPQEGSPIAHGMQVWFNEAVDEVTAEDPSNYEMVGGEFTILTATWIEDEDSNKVQLTTTDQPDAEIVTLKVVGVEDLNGNAIPPEDPEFFDFLCGYTDIYDIQTAGNGDTTQYYGYYATVRGRCSCAPNTYHWSNFYVTDESGAGTKDGVLCYTGDILGGQDAQVGDLVVLAGICSEYYNETEVVEIAYIDWYDSLCPPPDIFPCPPSCNWPYYSYHSAAEVSNNNPSVAELYEGTLCKVVNLEVVEVSSYTYYCVDMLGDTIIVGLEGQATYDPVVGDFVSGIGGILRYRYGEYRLTPRDDSDLDFNETALLDLAHPACIQIPPEGGSFQYDFWVTNNTGSRVTGDLWAMADLPSGGTYGPIQIYEGQTVRPYRTLSGTINQNVPGQAEVGVYIYHVYIGSRPGVKVDSTAFMLEKLGVASSMLAFSNWEASLLGEIVESGVYRPDLGAEEQLPVSFALHQNFPNPFNAKTSIQYDLPSKAEVRLEVYNLLGQRVATLIDGEKEAGYHSVTWDGSSVSSGIYFYKLTSGDFTAVKRLTLLK